MSKKYKILVVDREEIILKSIKKALKKSADLEYEIITCNTALDSLKLIRSNTFDLVLIDLVLPGLDGIEILRRIKNINPEIFIILMTGFSSTEIHTGRTNEEMSLKEIVKGAAGILFKPFTTEEINKLVSSVLQQ